MPSPRCWGVYWWSEENVKTGKGRLLELVSHPLLGLELRRIFPHHPSVDCAAI